MIRTGDLKAHLQEGDVDRDPVELVQAPEEHLLVVWVLLDPPLVVVDDLCLVALHAAGLHGEHTAFLEVVTDRTCNVKI